MAREVTSATATTSRLPALSSLPSFQVLSSGQPHAQSAKSARVRQTIPAFPWAEDGKSFEERMTLLVAELYAQFVEFAKLEGAIRANLGRLGYGQ